MKHLPLALLTALLLVASATAHAAERGTPDQAHALVKEAIAFYQSQGSEAALAEFSKKDGKFSRGDLYIFALDMEGVTRAHGANPALVGKNISKLKDPNGNFFVQTMIEKSKGDGGWVDYAWSNPTTKKIEPKTSYVEAVGNDLFLGCGAYR